MDGRRLCAIALAAGLAACPVYALAEATGTQDVSGGGGVNVVYQVDPAPESPERVTVPKENENGVRVPSGKLVQTGDLETPWEALALGGVAGIVAGVATGRRRREDAPEGRGPSVADIGT